MTDSANGRVVNTRQLTTGTMASGFGSLSSDGRSVAVLRGNTITPDVYLLPFEGGTPERLTFLNSNIWDVKWSPDGTSIAILSDATGAMVPMVVDVTGGELRPAGSGRTAAVRNWPGPLAWTADGKVLLMFRGSRDGTNPHVVTIALQTGDETEMETGDDLYGPVVSPDGQRVAVVGEHGLSFVSLDDGSQSLLVSRDQIVNMGAALVWADDGLIYFFVHKSGGTQSAIWHVSATGGTPQPYVSLPFDCFGISLARSARRMVCDVQPGSEGDIWVADNFDPGSR